MASLWFPSFLAPRLVDRLLADGRELSGFVVGRAAGRRPVAERQSGARSHALRSNAEVRALNSPYLAQVRGPVPGQSARRR